MGVTVIGVATTATSHRYRTISRVTIHLTVAMATMAATRVIIMATKGTADTMGTVVTVVTVVTVASSYPLAFSDLAFIRSPYQASSIPCCWLVFLQTDNRAIDNTGTAHGLFWPSPIKTIVRLR
jgi:hypothetical protein